MSSILLSYSIVKLFYYNAHKLLYILFSSFLSFLSFLYMNCFFPYLPRHATLSMMVCVTVCSTFWSFHLWVLICFSCNVVALFTCIFIFDFVTGWGGYNFCPDAFWSFLSAWPTKRTEKLKKSKSENLSLALSLDPPKKTKK